MHMENGPVIAINTATLGYRYEDEEAAGLSCDATANDNVANNGLVEKLAGLTVQEVTEL